MLLIGPPMDDAAEEADDTAIEAALVEAMERLPASKAAGEVARRFGRDRKALFDLATALKVRG